MHLRVAFTLTPSNHERRTDCGEGSQTQSAHMHTQKLGTPARQSLHEIRKTRKMACVFLLVQRTLPLDGRLRVE